MADGKNTVLLRDGFIESWWKPGSVVDADNARDAMRATAEATGGTPMPMLSHMTDVVISPPARYVFARATHVTAIAVLGSSLVDRVLAAAMNRHTDYPHRFFSSRAEAEEWLRGLQDCGAHAGWRA